MARSPRLVFSLVFLFLLSAGLAYASLLADCRQQKEVSRRNPCLKVEPDLGGGTLDMGGLGCSGAARDCGGGGGGPRVY